MEERKQSISISIPYPTLSKEKIKQKLFELFEIPYRVIEEKRSRFNFRFPQLANRFDFPQLKFNKKRIIQYLLPLILVLFIVIGIKVLSRVSPRQSSSTQVLGKSEEIKIAPPLATVQLNRDFKFSLRDEKGKEIATFAYAIESAELRKEILVKGQKATAVKGRVFLIVNLKIVNTLKSGITVNARDYVRLSVNGNTREMLAPEIHNDPVEVQAISTKYTRVGFAINETDKGHALQVGEIDGKKETIKLEFK